jgi:hypothetical protein
MSAMDNDDTDTIPLKGNLGKVMLDFSSKGIRGVPVRLTKRRARILDGFIQKVFDDYMIDIHEDNPYYDDYQATLTWLMQQIQKRYSRADLCD